MSFYPHFPGFWWPRLPDTVRKDGSSHAGWKLFLQHAVRFSSLHPALTQRARGQPKPHGHGSETAAGQAWDRAGKLRAGLRDSRRGEGSAALPEARASPRHAWAEAPAQQSPLALCRGPRSRPGALPAQGTAVPGCTPCPNLRRFPGSLPRAPFPTFLPETPGRLFPKFLQTSPLTPHANLRIFRYFRRYTSTESTWSHGARAGLSSEINPATGVPLPCGHPASPPTLPHASPLRSEGSQQIRSPEGSWCETQICRSWFLARVQTTFVPENLFQGCIFKACMCRGMCGAAPVPARASAKVTSANMGSGWGPWCTQAPAAAQAEVAMLSQLTILFSPLLSAQYTGLCHSLLPI